MKRLATKITVVLSTFAIAAMFLVPFASAGAVRPAVKNVLTSSPAHTTLTTKVKCTVTITATFQIFTACTTT